MNRREAIQRTAMVLGYAVSAPAIMGVLHGCKASPELTYKPEFFREEQAGVISEIAEIIIPRTDTPGAKDAGVPGFIDLMLRDCYKKEDQEKFMKGLADFQEACIKASGDPFLDLTAAKQKEYVKKVHDEAVAAIKSANPPAERPFILRMKELTMLGFFTSEPGATQVLQYSAVPGAYRGCVPLSEIGKTWAT